MSSSTPSSPILLGDNVGRGIGSILVAVFLFSIADAAAKWLGIAGYAAPQIVFFRYVFGMLPVVIMVWSAGPGALRTRKPMLHVLRALLLFSALVLFFAGLRVLPLAEAIAVAFTAPLFVTALSVPILHERVGPRRWAAVLIGFVGAIVMLRPGTDAFRPDTLLILASALFFALGMLLTRRMSATETNAAMFTYSTIGAGLASIPFMTVIWRAPEAQHLWVFLGLGIVGGCAAYLMIVAYRNAPAALIAPFEYSALIWGAIFGWMIWQEQPPAIVWGGAIIIVFSGLYITHREARGR